MEHLCYKCGQAVEQGTPFCPHCAAPQIRVILSEPLPAAAFPIPSTVSDTSDASNPVVLPNPAPVHVPPLARPCAIAALVTSLAIVLKLMVPLIAAIGAGFLAVALYRRQHPYLSLSAGVGARIGALAGAIGGAMTSVLVAIKLAIFHEFGGIRQQMLDAVQQQAARYSDPQLQPTIDFLKSSGGLVLMVACGLVFVVATFFLLGTIGGAIGGAAFGRRNKNQPLP